jgi:cell division protein FtsW
MGGSSLWFTCFAVGIILSVARNVEQMEGEHHQASAEVEAY